jgi:hypothetical protein
LKSQLIKNFVTDIALQIGVSITSVLIVDGSDEHYLQIFSGEYLVSALISKSELDDLKNGLTSNELKLKIRNALNRLQIQHEL